MATGTFYVKGNSFKCDSGNPCFENQTNVCKEQSWWIFWVAGNVFVIVTRWPVEFLAFILSILKTVSHVYSLVRQIWQYESFVLVNFLKWFGTFFELGYLFKSQFIAWKLLLLSLQKFPKIYTVPWQYSKEGRSVTDSFMYACICNLVLQELRSSTFSCFGAFWIKTSLKWIFEDNCYYKWTPDKNINPHIWEINFIYSHETTFLKTVNNLASVSILVILISYECSIRATTIKYIEVV